MHTETEQQMTISMKHTDHLSGRLLGPEGAAVVSTAVLSQVHPECPRLPQLEGEKLVSLTFVPKPWCCKCPAVWWQEVQFFRE